MEVRPATREDLGAINDIYNFYVLTSTATFDTEPRPLEEGHRWFEEHATRYPVLVAEADGEVVGWASLSRFHSRPAYGSTVEDSVYVRDERRGSGIGTQLLDRLLEEARKRAYHSVMALIGDSGNEASIRLHARLGFQPVGVEREVGYKFNRWLDVVLMQWMVPVKESQGGH